MSLTRTESDLIGTHASPASIAAGGNSSGAVDLTTTAGTFEAEIGAQVTIGSSPSAGPTVQFGYSLDGTNYFNDGGAITLPTTASTTFYVGPYLPPMAAKKAQITITNNDGGSVSITAWAAATTLASSNL